MPTEIGLN